MAKLGFGTGLNFGLTKKAARTTDTTTVAVVTSVAAIAGEPGDVATFMGGSLNAAGTVIAGKTYTAVSANPALVRVDSVVGRTVTCTILGATAGVNVVVSCDGQDAPPVAISGTWIVATIALTPTSVSIDTGGVSNLTATTRNRNGLLTPSPAFVGASSDTNVAIVGTISGSTVPVGGSHIGTATITVSSGGVTSNGVSVAVAAAGAAPPTPSTYRVTPLALSVAAGGTVTIRAQLLDQTGADYALGGQQITWTKTGAGGSFSNATSFTDASGLASVVLTATTNATVNHTVTATDVDGHTGTSTSIDVTPAAASAYTVAVDNVSPIPGATIGVTAQLRDAFGNPVLSSGVVVTWSSTNGGVFSTATSTTNASGLATVSFTVGVASTTHVVTATDTAVRTGSSATVTVQASADFSGPAELPRRVPNTDWVTPVIDGLTITPADSAALATAMTTLATADPTKNHAVILNPAVTYVGNFILPARGAGTGWVYIFTAALQGGTFPLAHTAYTRGVTETQGQRAGYQHSKAVTGGASIFPQVQSANNLPAFSLATSAHHYWIAGLEVCRTPGNTAIIESALINTGGPDDTYTSVLANVPHHVNITHCIVHGDLGKDTRRAIYANGSWIGIRDCSFYHIREAGADSQCVGYWNSPGALSVLNCFGESGGENILGGGAGPVMDTYPADFMKDITVQWCHLTKNPTISGVVKKNLDEHKNGARKLFKLCLVEHNTGEAQNGTSILYQCLNDSNISPPEQDISDLTFDTVKIVGGGPMMALIGRVGYASADGTVVFPLSPTRRVHVKNVYGKDVCGTLAEAAGTSGWLFQLMNGIQNLLIEHVTGEAVSVGMIFNRAVIDGVDTKGVTDFELRDCLLGKGMYGSLWEDGGLDGNAALADAVGGVVNVHNNVFYAPDGIPDNAAAYPAGNFYVAATAVGFAARVTQNPGALAVSSPYHNTATDGGDIGANVAAIDAMDAAVRETVLPW